MKHSEMVKLCVVTAKTELVLLDDGIYAREGRHWRRLQGEEELDAASEIPSRDAASLGEGGPDEEARQGDESQASYGTTGDYNRRGGGRDAAT